MSERQARELPQGWEWTAVGKVTESAIDQSGPNETGNFLYVDISSVDNKTKRISFPKNIPVNQAPSRAKQQLQPGDVVASMTRPNLNAVAMVPASMEHAIGSTGFHILRTNVINPFWLYYLVRIH